MAPHPAAAQVDQARANLEAALVLLRACAAAGVRQLVLCPGSRSGPLAVAAGWLERQGLALITAVDERSAAFFALGHGRARGAPAAVITTSGTAVANLLPAAVEADFGAIPLLLLTADRPARLKGCGANQTVNQETFLRDSLRWQGLADPAGLHAMAPAALRQLAERAVAACLGGAGIPPGAVQLNLPLEEPLHGEAAGLRALAGLAAEPLPAPRGPARPGPAPAPALSAAAAAAAFSLDPDRPGVIVAGPWRGLPDQWPGFVGALRQLRARSGWPLLADALSGLRGVAGLGPVAGYDLLLATDPPAPPPIQVLRLGPLPASRRLQWFLRGCDGPQLLISEGDPRPLDPLGRVSAQLASGLAAWWQQRPEAWRAGGPSPAARNLAERWRSAEEALQQRLDRELAALSPPEAAIGSPVAFSEPALARWLSRRLPPGLPLVLANSSPVRDWESFMPGDAPPRPVFSFRGASGIDGTLSLACGVAEALGHALLVSGDLALLHDSNGWLWRGQLRGRLTVLLLDNAGGGIFEQLPIRVAEPDLLDFERLFAMPQAVDPLALAAAHGVPARECGHGAALESDLAWALAQPLALLRLRCDRRADAAHRRALRTMGVAPAALP
jgi:2-succinyl-5-enolpyruvyl-6-hydroxy-3-cyclohexene-1-carboxylate synthase